MRGPTAASILVPVVVAATAAGALGFSAYQDSEESQAVASANTASESLSEQEDLQYRLDAINKSLDSGPVETAPSGDQLAQEANAEGRLIHRNEPGAAEQTTMHVGQYAGSNASGDLREGRAGDGFTPGMTLYTNALAGGGDTCTISFAATDPAGVDTALTAGHCMVSATKEVEYPDGDLDNAVPMGEFVGGKSSDGSVDSGFPGHTDYAVVSLDSSVEGTRLIGDQYRVTEVYGPNDLHPGMEVCKVGGRSGETCGPVIASNDTMARSNLYSHQGDSGAPVFVKLGGENVAAVGIVSSIPGTSSSDATPSITDLALVQPIADFHGLSLTFE